MLNFNPVKMGGVCGRLGGGLVGKKELDPAIYTVHKTQCTIFKAIDIIRGYLPGNNQEYGERESNP
ncbi:MAG: hypothetical protein L6282_04305 [Candidatus Methanoperedenaceae archaeon]|nr:hypothetical protein [Candidatus Methanoperedenaceae archaeon]